MIELIHPKGWLKGRGYSHGTAITIEPGDKLIHVAGMIGWNGDQQFESDDFVAQTAQALKNIVAVLAASGASSSDILSMTWYITDKAECMRRQRELGAVYREEIGDHYPAMAMVEVTSLMEDRALVEIEVRAVSRPDRA